MNDEEIKDLIWTAVRAARDAGWNEDEIKQEFKTAIDVTDQE